MGDKSSESDGMAVASTEQMSLFDEEILFDDDPNNAYFKYLVGMNQEDVDDTLTGDSGVESQPREYQAPVNVQKEWLRMEGAAAVESDTDSLEETNSLPRGLDCIPIGVFDNVVIERDPKDAHLPSVVYLGVEVGSEEKSGLEQAPEQAPATAALSSPHETKMLFFGRNRRVIIVVLVFFFLTTIGLAAALVMHLQRSDDDGTKDPTTIISPGSDGRDPATDDEFANFSSPTTSPVEQLDITTSAPTSGTTSAPTSGTTSAPTSGTTSAPTIGTTKAPTIVTTSAPTLSPTIASPTPSPTTTATDSPTLSPTNPPTVSPTIAPTQPPTSAPTDPLSFELEELIAFLAFVSPDGGVALSNRTTNQFFAALWLSKESGLTWYSDQTKIQRYALATLYLSTSGYQWINSAGWLTEQDECNWFSDYDADDACNFNGDIERLYLPANNLKGSLPSELALLSNGLGELFLRHTAPQANMCSTHKFTTVRFQSESTYQRMA